MTRKMPKTARGARRCTWKTTLIDHTGGVEILKSIALGVECAERWSELKKKLNFQCDADLLDYLLGLGEAHATESMPSSDWPPNESAGTESSILPRTGNSGERKNSHEPHHASLRRSTRITGTAKGESETDAAIADIVTVKDPCVHAEKQCGKPIKNSTAKKDDEIKHLRKKKGNVKAVNKNGGALNEDPAIIVDTIDDTEKAPDERGHKYRFKNDLHESDSPPLEVPRPHPLKERSSKSVVLKRDFQKNGTPKTVTSSFKKHLLKTGKKRWQSYHKDKRKWKQSYAAVSNGVEETDANNACENPGNVGSSVLCNGNDVSSDTDGKASALPHSIQAKERQIFKVLNKNRIVKKCDSFDTKTTAEKELETDSIESPEKGRVESSSKRGIRGMPLSGVGENMVCEEENEDGETTLVENFRDAVYEHDVEVSPMEPVFIEVGERVKLKRRKKRLSQDSDGAQPVEKEVERDFVNVKEDWRIRDKYRKQKKHKRKIDFDQLKKPEDEQNFKNLGEELQVLNENNNVSDEIDQQHDSNQNKYPEVSTEISKEEYDCCMGETLKSNIPSDEVSNEVQECVAIKIKMCSNCNSRHPQEFCPLQNPLQIMEDSVSLELWQLRSQMQVRCSVIESPKPKTARTRKLTSLVSDIGTKDGIPVPGKAESSSFAEESLPLGLTLHIVEAEHGKTVVAGTSIAKYTQFGPLIGQRIHEKDISDESDMRHIWEVADESETFYVTTDDPQKSNWLRFMRPAPTRELRNVTLVTKKKELFFITISEINSGMELLYWVNDYATPWAKKKVLKSSCGGCNMQFTHPLYYRTHCAVFHDPNHSLTIRKYHCKVCGEAILGKENIMKHAAELHQGRGAYQCQFCNKFFLRLNYLEMHRTYGCAANPQRTRPLCDFCGRKFCQPQKLKVHIKRMHSDMNEVLREFQCKECFKILGSRAALQRHLKEVHHREEIVAASSCERCGKSFQNRSNLKIHMLTHSGIKPFPCQQTDCKAAFTTKQCLQFHYKKVHGFTEESLPPIKRSIAYTFESYAGGDGSSESQAQNNSTIVERKGRKVMGRRDNQHKKQQSQKKTVQSHEDQSLLPQPLHPPVSFPSQHQEQNRQELKPRYSQALTEESRDERQPHHEIQQYCTVVDDGLSVDVMEERLKFRYPAAGGEVHPNEEGQQQLHYSRILSEGGETEQNHPQSHIEENVQQHLQPADEESRHEFVELHIQHQVQHKQEMTNVLGHSEAIQGALTHHTRSIALDEYSMELARPSSHKIEADTSRASPPSGTVMPHSFCRDDKPGYGGKTLTPLITIATTLSTSSPEYLQSHTSSNENCHSPSMSPPSSGRSPNKGVRAVLSKGSKKWLGEALEVVEEAAAAAMRLSPRLSPRVKRDMYDFDDDTTRRTPPPPFIDDAVRQDLQSDIGLGRSLAAGKVVSALSTFHRPESASMLVEAALDAAERDVDICCSMNNSSSEKAPHSTGCRTPDSLHMSHTGFRMYSPRSDQAYYSNDRESAAVPGPEISSDPSHYPPVQSPELQPRAHVHMDSYGMGMVESLSGPSDPSGSASPRVYQHQQAHVHHHMHHHQVIQQNSLSSDEEGGGMEPECSSRSDGVQNLSLGSKEKAGMHLELSSMPMYSMPEAQGIDMSARSSVYHPSPQGHAPPSSNGLVYSSPIPSSPPRYHMYDLENDHHSVDLSVPNRGSPSTGYNHYSEMARTVDLSLPRTHSTSSSMSNQVSSSGHVPLLPQPRPDYLPPPDHAHSSHAHSGHLHHGNVMPGPAHAGPGHLFALPPGLLHSLHPPAYQAPPLQRAQISSSSNSPSPSPSPSTSQYHSYYL